MEYRSSMPAGKVVIDKRIDRILFTNASLNQKCQEAANWINATYASENPIIIGVLKDAVPFFGEVTRRVNVSCETDFVQVVENSDEKGRRFAEVTMDVHSSLLQRDVVILVAIVDTGLTIAKLVSHFRKLSAKSVRVLALIRRKGADDAIARPTLSFFEIERQVVAGFGIGYNGIMRNLPYIGSVKGASA